MEEFRLLGILLKRKNLEIKKNDWMLRILYPGIIYLD
jgi:hypothetical protein